MGRNKKKREETGRNRMKREETGRSGKKGERLKETERRCRKK